jgi:predicted nucleic-acid-binding Zn-ribbon protein
MKNSSTCPKCSNDGVKKNAIGGWQNMALGEIYRCTGCGYSEIWSSKSHNNQINAIAITSIIIILGVIGYLCFRIYTTT